jgi:hypothetical protein
VIAIAAAAARAAADPVLQTFDIRVAGPFPGQVTANGAAVTGRGTATPTSATSYSLLFPTGPGSLTETVVHTTGGIGAGCVERLSQSGTFKFSYFPTAVVRLRFGGSGTYTQSSVTVYLPLLRGGCDTTTPLQHTASVHAEATEVVFAVL